MKKNRNAEIFFAVVAVVAVSLLVKKSKEKQAIILNPRVNPSRSNIFTPFNNNDIINIQ